VADEPVTLLAVADVNVERERPNERFDLTRDLLRAGDITFGQLEIPLSNAGERQLPGGLSTKGAPKDPRAGARVLAAAGFNVMSFAGNHTMDLSAQSMFDTIEAVRAETDIRLVGAGATIDEARTPAIVDVRGTRVGFLAYCTVLLKNFWAGEQVAPDGTVSHRPGVAPLRAHTAFEDVDWQPGNRPRIITHCDSDDLAAMLADIRKLREQVDVVVVSVHWGIHFEPGTVAMYQVEAAHAAIEAGADLILGHHPHIIKGIEFYRGAPIFYGINNFVLAVRDHNGRLIGPGENDDSQKTFIAKFTIRDKKIDRVSLIPCFLENTRLQPEPLSADDPRAEEIRKYLEWACANNTPDFASTTNARRAFPPFTTTFAFEGDEIVATA